jgi:hypothetical protein
LAASFISIAAYWHSTSFRCDAGFARDRSIADYGEPSARQMMGSRLVFVRCRVWFLAVHMRHHLGEVAHIDQRAADGTVSEMLGLRPVQIVHIDASVARQLLRSFDVRLKSLGKIRRSGLIGSIADRAWCSGSAAGTGARA